MDVRLEKVLFSYQEGLLYIIVFMQLGRSNVLTVECSFKCLNVWRQIYVHHL